MKQNKIFFLLIVFISLNSIQAINAKEYFLNTAKYSEDGGETIIRKPTKFIINLQTFKLSVIQNGKTTVYDILDTKNEPDEIKSDGVTTKTIFECMSYSNIEHLFVLIQTQYNNGSTVTSMADINRVTNKTGIYIK